MTVFSEITTYNTYPIVTNTRLDVKTKLPFPAVTVCNLSAFNKSRFSPDPKQQEYMDKIRIGESVNWSDPDMNSSLFYAPLTREAIQSYSMDKSLSFIYVFFDNVNASDNLVTTMTEHGMCHTFNANGTFSTQFSGTSYNLYMNIWIDQSNYLTSADISAGVSVSL
jgi:hypothetical protein